MKRIALLLMLAALGCRRTHGPGPGAEPEPSPATSVTAPATPPSAAAPTEPAPTAPATGTPAQPSLPMPDGGTINGDPRGPRPAEVKAVLDAALVEVRACFDASPDIKPGEIPVSVTFTVEPPGYTGGITLKADAPKDVLDCAHAVYDKLKFREYRGPKVTLTRAFTYWKKALGSDGGAAK